MRPRRQWRRGRHRRHGAWHYVDDYTHGRDLTGVFHRGKPFDMTLLWTIQRIPAWQQLQTTGVLTATAENAMPDSGAAYAWMIARMRERLGPPPEPDGFPVWAWYRYGGVKKPRPDLRRRAHLDKGVRGVRIAFECEPKTLLLSDINTWTLVLNGSYVTTSEDDAESYHAEVKARGLDYGDRWSDPKIAAKIVRSWDKIFHLRRYDPDWLRPPDERSIQACLWEVKMSQVRDVTEFVSR
jgi:hypothetical protein